MTYLQLVNAVLTRLREDSVTSVAGSDDVVVNIVKDFVNDAKRSVEDAHTWSALATEWAVTSSTANNKLILLDSSRSVVLDEVYSADGFEITPLTKSDFRKRTLSSGSAKGSPSHYIVDGTETNGDIRLAVWPAPATAEAYVVYGYSRTPDLVNDSDTIVIPSSPVIYLAEALAARERGEVGGQSAGELMGIAKQYLSDAIAKDSTNSDLENIWTTI